MTISKNNDIDYDSDIKGMLHEEYASEPSKSLEGIIEDIEIIYERIRTVEYTPVEAKKYKEKIIDLFFAGKQLIYKITSRLSELCEKDKQYFMEIKAKYIMLKEQVELIDFDAILEYTKTIKIYSN